MAGNKWSGCAALTYDGRMKYPISLLMIAPQVQVKVGAYRPPYTDSTFSDLEQTGHVAVIHGSDGFGGLGGRVRNLILLCAFPFERFSDNTVDQQKARN